MLLIARSKLVPASFVVYIVAQLFKFVYHSVLDALLLVILYFIFNYTELVKYKFYILQILKFYTIDVKYYYNYSTYVTGLSKFFDTQIEFVLSLFNYRGSKTYNKVLLNFFITYILPQVLKHV